VEVFFESINLQRRIEDFRFSGFWFGLLLTWNTALTLLMLAFPTNDDFSFSLDSIFK